MIANQINCSIYASIAGNTISRSIKSEEVEELLDGFLRNNIENYDKLLNNEIQRVEQSKRNETELEK